MRASCFPWCIAALGLAVTALPGCFFFGGTPDDVDIACTTDADCPADWFCVDYSSRCVPESARDEDAPRLLDGATVTPDRARRTVTLVATFEVSETLADAPTVEIDAGDDVFAPFTLDADGSDGDAGRWVYRYDVNGAEAEGARNVLVSFRDLAGLGVDRAILDTVELDFTAPFITQTSVPVQLARRETEVTASFTVDDALAGEVVLTFAARGGGAESFVVSDGAATAENAYAFSFTPDENTAEGDYALTVDLEDLAGNIAAGVEIGQVTLDFTSPQPVADDPISIVPAAGAPGQRVDVDVRFDEDIASFGNLVATLEGDATTTFAFDPADSNPTRLRFDWLIQPGQDGTWNLSLSDVTDAAGNVTPDISVGSVVFDGTAPEVLNFTQSNTALLADDTLTVTFETSEPLGIEPTVTLGSLPMMRQGIESTPYTYTLPLADTGLSGTYEINLRLLDAVNNEANIQPGTVDVDAIPAELVDVIFNPQAARLNVTAILSVTASEPLSATPVLTWDAAAGDPGFVYFGQSGLTHTWTLAVDSAVGEGAYQLSEVGIVDVAGNATTATDGSLFGVFNVDNVPPVVSGLVTDAQTYSAAAGYNVITATFDVDENLDAGALDVEIGANDFVCLPYQAASPNYTCTLTVVGDETEGLGVVAVSAADPAGNIASASTSVILDFTPPQLGSTNVQLGGPPTCALNDVGAVTVGASGVYSFTVSETLAGDPVLSTSAGTWTTTKDTVASGGLFYEYSLMLDAAAGADQGAMVPTIVLVDAVGNTSDDLSLPALSIDTEAPAAPDVDSPGRVTYQRVPWGFDEGRDGAFDPKTFRLTGVPGAVDNDTTYVVAYDGPDPAVAGEIGVAEAGGTAFGPFDLNRADRTEVYAVAFDAACNASGAVRVRDVIWTVTMGNKVQGSTIENAHTWSTTSIMGNTLLQKGHPAEPSSAELSRLERVDGQSLSGTAEVSWRVRAFAAQSPPSARDNHAVAYDSVRGKLVVFGGYAGGMLADTWELDSQSGRWTDVTPTTPSPQGRRSHTMAFDHARGKVVLFGGDTFGGSLADTWEWDGTTGSWTDVTPVTESPPVRGGHAMVYDSARGRVVMFGGREDYAAPFQDTWEWDGERWTEITTTGAPTAQYGCAMAYDRGRRRVVLFGGYRQGGPLSDMWEYDGISASWTLIPPVVGDPAARASHAMAYDDARDRVVMFGGRGVQTSPNDETWELDGTNGNWTEFAPGSSGPVARSRHALAFDTVRQQVTMFGGYPSGPLLQDTWAWDGANAAWTTVGVAVEPPPNRSGFAMAFDRGRNKVVLFGGHESNSSFPLSSTWEWDGSTATWTDVTPAAGSPEARHSAAMAYDDYYGTVVLFGGRPNGVSLQDTWEWDGNAGTWTDVTPLGTSPSARFDARMAYDPSRLTVVLFGGQYSYYDPYQDTWEWDGGTWTEVTPATDNPPARAAHNMAYVDAVGSVVMFGGRDYDYAPFADLWQWDGAAATWTDITPPTGSPPAREHASLANDDERGRLILFGGFGNGVQLQDTWAWTAATSTWTEISPSLGNPSPRSSAGMVFDAQRGAALLFGGCSSTCPPETWELDNNEDAAPAQTLAVRLGASGASTTWSVGSIAIQVYAGGTAFPSGVPTHGADLLIWDEGKWKPVASNGDSASAPDVLQWSINDAETIYRLMRSPELNVAVRPTAPNGEGSGEIAVDYAEVTLSYRLP